MSIERLRDFDYLLSNFYTVDSSTMIGPEQLNADDLLGRSMKINKKEDGPKVLIFHYSFIRRNLSIQFREILPQVLSE